LKKKDVKNKLTPPAL